MPRIPVRWDGVGQWYFVTVVTLRRRPVFADESACKLLQCAFREVRQYHPFRLAALVILPDHWHALIRPGIRSAAKAGMNAGRESAAPNPKERPTDTGSEALPQKRRGRNPALPCPMVVEEFGEEGKKVVIEEVVGAIKKNVARNLRMKGPTIWQPRFLDHRIRDEDDFLHHLEYICSNPIKHGYATSPDQYQWCFIHPRPFA